MRRRHAMSAGLVAAVAVAACVAAPLAAAQTYPTKPIRTVMTLGGGGSAETAARSIADKLSAALGQPVLVESHGGAGGSVGANLVARAAPDGYTILFGTTSSLVLRHFLVKGVPYDTRRDFTPITQIGETISCVVAGSGMPADTLAGAIEFAKKNPGKVTFGSSGIGTTHHLSGEIIQKLTGVKMVHVPYKGSSGGITDAVAGRIHLMFGTLGSMRPQIGPGQLKLLAINNGKRFSQVADVATIAEIIPGYDRPPSWVGYLGPAGLPKPIVDRLHKELNRAIEMPDTVERLARVGILADPSSPEEFAAFIKHNFEAAGEMMQAAGVKPR